MPANRRSAWARVGIVVLILGCGGGTRAYGFAGGTGEPNNPYQIATAADLLAIGSDRNLLDKHFVLMNDIDLDPNLPGGRVFDDALIARDESEGVSGHAGDPFRGVLDGRGHSIRNLQISGKYGYDAALFGKLSGLVQDLHLQDVRISGSPCGALAGLNERGLILRCSVTGRISGAEETGGLVGVNWDGSLMDCRADVQVTGTKNVGGMVGGGPGGTLIRCELRGDIHGDSAVGGLVGELRQGQIVDSRAAGTVAGTDYVGGLVGDMAMAASILRSTADCDVTAEQTAGGLAGNAALFAPHGQLVADCYARGSVAGSITGGLIGNASDVRIVNCYAACEMIPAASPAATSSTTAVGGLWGNADAHSPPLVTGCFWDVELSNVHVGAGSGPGHYGTGLTTQQMQQRDAFQQAKWDLGYTWAMPENDYPVLQWEPARAESPKTDADSQ